MLAKWECKCWLIRGGGGGGAVSMSYESTDLE